MRIDYLGLEAFVAIAELGSFSKAAQHLNLSQTALSHRIRKLEEDLGVQLLVRTSRDVSLTKSGQALLPQVRGALHTLGESYDGLRTERRLAKRLSFACLPTIAQHYLPDILREFAEERPDIELQIYDQPVQRALELVQQGEVEFGISILGAGRWDLEFEPIYTEPYILIVRGDHPLAKRKSVSRDDLEGLPFVRIRSQSTIRQLVNEALGEYRERILWRYEVNSAATALRLVAAGAAATVLPELATHLSQDRVVGLPFHDVEMQRTLAVIKRRGAPISEPGARLVAMIRDRLKER